MHYDGWSFGGMHFFWWLFWIAVIVALFSAYARVPRRRRDETPLEILQRRYAAGEISADEYQERRRMLEGHGKPRD